MKPGSKVLYLGAASGTSVSHVSDIVGPTGVVYAVEFSHRSGRDLVGLATKRTNIIPIVEDARHPLKYRMLVGMVDCIFADVAQPDQGMSSLIEEKHSGMLTRTQHVSSVSMLTCSSRSAAVSSSPSRPTVSTPPSPPSKSSPWKCRRCAQNESSRRSS